MVLAALCRSPPHPHASLPNVRIWNERDYDAGWLLRFRSALDLQGHHHVKIVVADTHWVCDDFVGNQTLLDAVGVFGAHYPITGRSHAAMPASCLTLGKPLWTSEGWSLREVNDYDGAMNLAMTVNYNWLDQRQTAFIVWTVVYAWYSILPFAHPVDGLVGGMGHGLVSATQPWSGHYRIQPTLYVLAHTTQFVRPGCRYIDATSTLSGGKFPTGSNGTDSVASAVAFRCPDDNTVTLVVETGDAKEAISASFELKSQNSTLPDVLHVWQTCNETYFERLPDSAIGQDGTLRVSLLPRCLYTFSSSSGQSGVPSAAIPAPSRFPKSYADTFDGYPDQGTVRYFTDQGGSFNAAPSPSGSGMVLEQVVDVRPIEWGHNPDPFTIAGDSQTWSNYSVFVDAMITSKSPLPPSPPPIVVHVVNRTSLQPCRPGSPLQQFSLDGLLLRSASSPGGCLGAGYVDAKWTGVRDAAVVTCNASDPWQQWTVRMGQRGGAHVELAAGAACSSTSCCLNVDGGKTTAGNGLLLWKCDTEADENWSFDESVLRYVGDASHGSYCVAVDGGPSPGPPGPPPSTQPSETSVKVCGRIGRYARGGSPPAGICLILDDRGMWYVVDGDGKSGSVREVEHVLATGRQPQGVDPEAGWVRVGLKFAGDSATAVVQGSPVATVGASHWPAGMIGLGSGWNKAMFDNLNITAGQP